MPRLKTLTRRNRFRPALEKLEDRTQPAGFSGLGAAGQFAVLGLEGTRVHNDRVVVSGDEGVSHGGRLTNERHSAITGDVFEFAKKEYSGRGTLGGGLHVDPGLLNQADADALDAAADAAALVPTQTLGTVKKATTVTGNGGLNVISVRGDVRASLTLTGTAADVFVVNVSGNLDLAGRSFLGLGGGVTPDHILYNLAGRHVAVGTHAVVDGTLLAPHANVVVEGTVNGGVVGGGRVINLNGHASVNGVPFVLPAPPSAPAGTGLSGTVFLDGNNDGVQQAGETGIIGIEVDLTGLDVNGNVVSLFTFTDIDGHFSFTDLAPGTYTITELNPPFGSLHNGPITVGTVNGRTDGTVQGSNAVGDIVLHAGDSGVGYVFATNFGGL